MGEHEHGQEKKKKRKKKKKLGKALCATHKDMHQVYIELIRCDASP